MSPYLPPISMLVLMAAAPVGVAVLAAVGRRHDEDLLGGLSLLRALVLAGVLGVTVWAVWVLVRHEALVETLSPLAPARRAFGRAAPFAIGAMMAAPFVGAFAVLYRRLPRGHGSTRCAGCGYALEAADLRRRPVCPECGREMGWGQIRYLWGLGR